MRQSRVEITMRQSRVELTMRQSTYKEYKYTLCRGVQSIYGGHVACVSLAQRYARYR
jgi:hypothetical protein